MRTGMTAGGVDNVGRRSRFFHKVYIVGIRVSEPFPIVNQSGSPSDERYAT
jgi:hypothetical protein